MKKIFSCSPLLFITLALNSTTIYSGEDPFTVGPYPSQPQRMPINSIPQNVCANIASALKKTLEMLEKQYSVLSHSLKNIFPSSSTEKRLQEFVIEFENFVNFIEFVTPNEVSLKNLKEEIKAIYPSYDKIISENPSRIDTYYNQTNNTVD